MEEIDYERKKGMPWRAWLLIGILILILISAGIFFFVKGSVSPPLTIPQPPVFPK